LVSEGSPHDAGDSPYRKQDPGRLSRKETVLVTGASSGIGLELAHRFAASGSQLVLVARRVERLDHLAAKLKDRFATRSLVRPTDLSEPGDRRSLLQELGSSGWEVDVLVNNAGFGLLGKAVDLDIRRQMEMVEVNVSALTDLTLRLLPGMVTRRRGGILNLASTAAFQPGPRMAVYYATKAHVLSFTEALAQELRGTGVVATCLAPGPTETDFPSKTGINDAVLAHLGTMDPEQVARAGYRGFRKGRVVVVPGLLNRMGTFAVRLTPRGVARKLVDLLHRKG